MRRGKARVRPFHDGSQLPFYGSYGSIMPAHSFPSMPTCLAARQDMTERVFLLLPLPLKSWDARRIISVTVLVGRSKFHFPRVNHKGVGTCFSV